MHIEFEHDLHTSVGDNKLILMTNTFDIICENGIEREDFGEGI